MLGYSCDVLPAMQRLSHRTRAYIWNADGLPGFLAKASLMQVLRAAHLRGDLKEVTRWQEFDFDSVMAQLEQKCDKHKLKFFEKHYPCIFVYI